MSLFWLSFCDADRSKESQFLGVAVVEAATLEDAVRRAWLTGCNPGGEVMGLEIPTEMTAVKADLLARTPRDTLLNRAQLAALGLKPASLGELKEASR